MVQLCSTPPTSQPYVSVQVMVVNQEPLLIISGMFFSQNYSRLITPKKKKLDQLNHPSLLSIKRQALQAAEERATAEATSD